MAGSDGNVSGNKKQFIFLYLPKEEIANEVELHEENEDGLEESGGEAREEARLKKKLWLVPITGSMNCCKKNCLQNISVSHLANLRLCMMNKTYI